MSVLFSTEINLVSIICWHLTKIFPVQLAEPHNVPVIPAHCMSQLFKFPSWPKSSHIPCSTEMFSVPLIFLIFGTPMAYLSPTSRCLTVGAVIVISGCERSGIKVLLVFILMVFLGQSPAWRSPSLSRLIILTKAEIYDYCMARLGHEHVRWLRVLPPWPLTSSRKTFAKWCCVITTPNWPIGLGDLWRW